MRLGTGLLATMAALAVGLLIASAKGSYDAQRSDLTQVSADIIGLDRVMAHYGPETKDALEISSVAPLPAASIACGRRTRSQAAQVEPTAGPEALWDGIQGLSPQNDAQRLLQAQALRLSTDLGRTRWLLFEQRSGSIPLPFLVVLISWVTILFISFSLFAPPNATVMATLLVCALSVSGAIFLILELDQPFGGFIQLSSAPLRDALARLGQ